MEVPLTAGPSTGSVDGSGGCCRSTARQLQLCKLLYFLEGFSFASFGRFATLYYLSRGLDAHEIGLIEACRPATAIVGGVLFGWLSDRLRRKKAVFLATRVASTTVLLLLPAPFIGSSFPRILALNAGGGFVGVGIGVLDAYTLDLLGERSTEYGQYRLWLAVSWGVGNAVMGNVAQISFDYNFILFGGLTAIELVLIAAVLPARTRSELKLRADDARLHLQEEERAADAAAAAAAADRGSPSLRRVLLSPRVLLFLAEVTGVGVLMALVERFLFVYATNELLAPPSLCGYAVGCNVIVELPIFHYGARLLRTLGHDLMFVLALAAYAGRVYGYTRLTPATVWWLLALEVLHGVTFGLAWTAAVDYAKAAFPKRWQTTAQMLTGLCNARLGVILGALLGGFFMQHGAFLGETDGRALYLLASVAAAALLVAHAAATLGLRACGARGLLTPPPSAAGLPVTSE